jgi:hypothetical protein
MLRLQNTGSKIIAEVSEDNGSDIDAMAFKKKRD